MTKPILYLLVISSLLFGSSCKMADETEEPPTEELEDIFADPPEQEEEDIFAYELTLNEEEDPDGDNLGDGVLWQSTGDTADCGNLIWRGSFEAPYLNADGKKITVKATLSIYERCVKLATGGGDEIDIRPPDAQEVIGTTSITCFDKSIDDTSVGTVPRDRPDAGEQARRTGEVKVFAMTGPCDAYTVKQMKQKSGYWTAAPDKKHEGSWKPDPGPSGSPKIGATAMHIDIPSAPKVRKGKRKYSGRVYHEIHRYQTFFYCDGTLVGWYTWGYEVDIVFSGDEATRGVPTSIAPVWGAPPAKSESGGEDED